LICFTFVHKVARLKPKEQKKSTSFCVVFAGLDRSQGSSVEGSEAAPLAGATAPVWWTSPGTTGRIGAAAAVVVVHGRQSGSNGSVGQGVGYRSTGSLATHFLSGLTTRKIYKNKKKSH